MQVKELMSTHLEAITPTTTIQECAKKMEQLGVGALPVWDNGHPIGVVTDRDICCRAAGAGLALGTPARAIMSPQVTSCFDYQDCAEAVRLMKDKGVRRLMVLDRNNAMVGIFSVDDLARYSHDLAGEVLEAVAPWPH